MRLDTYLVNEYPHLSRSQIQQYIKAGRASVNGREMLKSAYDLSESDTVDFTVPKQPDYRQDILDFAQYVVYQDDNVVVINKPAGVLTHAKGGIVQEFTVADYIRSLYDPAEVSVATDNNRLGIVHRLDRATSGILICAKNNTTQAMLARQFAERKSKKTYLAITEKAPTKPTAQINLPIARNLAKPASFKVDGKGKEAVTDYVTLAEYPNGQALLELKPATGRTHQLRVHLAYLHCPIVGDPVYGHGKYGDRLMLHAWKLEITIPGLNGEAKQRKTFTAEPPNNFNLTGVKLD